MAPATGADTTGKPLTESDRVEGKSVYDPRGKNIGSIKRLVIGKISGRRRLPRPHFAANAIAAASLKQMGLSLHPTDASPTDADWSEYTILRDGRPVGRIFERHSVPELPWFWSITTIPSDEAGIYTYGRAATMETAKADFQANYRRWLTWAKLEAES